MINLGELFQNSIESVAEKNKKYINSRDSWVQGAIDKLMPDAFAQLENIAQFDERVARRIAFEIMRWCCNPQNASNIVAGRKAFGRLPVTWVASHISVIINIAVNFEDEWEYRRLLEVLKEHKPDLL